MLLTFPGHKNEKNCHKFVSKTANHFVTCYVLIGKMYQSLFYKKIISMKKSFLWMGMFAATLFAASCSNKSDFTYYHYSDEDYSLISEKLNLPPLPSKYSAQLPEHLTRAGLSGASLNSDQATLGRVLFYDKNLSSDKTVSCASCHRQEIGFSDDRAVSIGVEGRAGTRNSIALSSVANFAAYYGNDLFGPSGIPFFWDNRAGTAAAQNIGSMTNPLEMNMQDHEIAAAVKAQEFYRPLFKKAFDDETITTARISEAIAAFVNAMGSYRSRFDQAANEQLASQGTYGAPNYDAHFASFTAAENAGKQIYQDNCSSCHSKNFGRPIKFLSNNGLDESTTDKGVGGVSFNSSELGTFKVPTLRNIAITGPYMHDGRFATLSEVIDHYSTGIKSHPNLASELRSPTGGARQMNFSATDKENLIAFLNTLTDDEFKVDERFANPFK
jgi:cytochrome c peroxidase